MTTPKEATREALPEPLKLVAERIYAAIDYHRNSTYCWQGNIEGAYEQAVAQHGAKGVAKVAAILSAALESERQAHAAEVERLRGDAERYKLLRRGQHWSVIDGMGYTLRAEQIDAAIDQAIARGKT